MTLNLRRMCSPTTHCHTPFGGVLAMFVCLSLWTFPLYAQQGGSNEKIVIDAVTITGKVTEVSGEPLPGVTIFLENSPYGTASDIDGNYSLKIPTAATQGMNILYGMIGMKTKNIQYTGQEVINVVLEEDLHALEDVVVTGMANIKRADMVGSYQTVKMDDISQPNYTTLDQMLQGQVAGMIVTNNTTRAGGKTTIKIRGNATLIGNTEPLWVIDGIPQAETMNFELQGNIFGEGSSVAEINQYIGSQISWLNPNDIESVTVLKDASATALYGSRASNGVIVINTKKPEQGRFSVNFQANMSINQKPNYGHYNVMNSQERVRFSQEAFAAGITYPLEPLAQLNTYEGAYLMYRNMDITYDEFVKQYNRLETVNTDWLDILTRNAVTQNYTVTLAGAMNNLSINSSLGYTKQQGTEIGNDTERFTGRVAGTYIFSPTVKVDMAIAGTTSTTNGFAAGVNPLTYATTTSRAIPVKEENGDLVYYRTKENFYSYNKDPNTYGLGYNILNERDNSGTVLKHQTVSANMTLVWDILPMLRYEFMGGYNSQTRDSESYAGAKTQYIARRYRGYDYGTVEPNSGPFLAALLPFGGELSTVNAHQETYNLKNSLIFRKTYNEIHRVNLTALWDIQSTSSKTKQNAVWGYDKERGETISKPRYLNEVIGYGGGVDGNASYYGVFEALYTGGWKSLRRTDNLMSVAALLTYNFKERYALNINFRNDASNRFGQDVNKRFDPTYSFGVAWHMANESFMNQFEWLNDLTVKTTFGIQGNSLNNISPDLIFSMSSMSSIYNDYVSGIAQLENPLLGWERTKTWNFGMDLSMFNGRLTMALDGYSRLTNATNKAKLAPELGNKFATPIRGNHIRNTGIESVINIVAIQQKDWRLNFSFNISKNWNKITKIADIENEEINVSSYINGQESKLLEKDYAYGAFWAYSFAGLDPETGYPTFNNLDLEDATNYTDFLVYVGNKIPSITSGLNISLSYKHITLSGLFSAVTGGKDFLPNPYAGFYSGRMPEPTSNLSHDLVNRWKSPGDITDIPAVFTSKEEISIPSDPITGSTYTTDRYRVWADSDVRVASTAFLKCRTLSLSWYDSSKFWRTAGIQNIRVTASANNIFTIADKKWNGIDPENGGVYNVPRSYTVGLALSF